jgi:hypothetical protein
MAYAATNPPCKIADTIGGGASVWIYKSADVDSDVNAASYFSNGVSLGMAVGDIVLVIDTATPKGSFHYVASVSGDAATTAFGAVA